MSHLTNLLLHIFAVWLLFILLIKFNVKRETAFLLSLIFGVHPLAAQTVSFIPGRNDSLLAIFVFPALWFFLDLLQTHRMRSYFWHLIFLAAALFTKETAVIVPVLCSIYAVIFIGWKKIIADLTSYLYLLIGWLSLYSGWFLIRKAVFNSAVGNADYHIIPSIFQNLPALAPAVGKIFLPFNLSVFPILRDMTMLYGTIALALLGFWFVFSRNKNYRMIIFGAMWFGLFILPTLIKPMNSISDFNENRIYLPMLGFVFVLLGMGRPAPDPQERNDAGQPRTELCSGLGRVKFAEFFDKKIITILGLLLIIVFSSITVSRHKYFENGVSFWRNAVATSPSFAFNHNNLGAMYYLGGKYDLAEKEFRRALEINPQEKISHNNLGLIYAGRGDFESAIKEYEAELKLNPVYGNTLYNMGLAYWNMSKKEEAVEKWKEAISTNPDYFDAYKAMIGFYQDNGQKDLAEKLLLELQRRGGL